MTEPSRETLDAWHDLVDKETAFTKARMAFGRRASDRAEVLLRALYYPADRGPALRVICLPLLNGEERQLLLPKLLDLAPVYSERDIGLVLQALRMYDIEWFEGAAAPHCSRSTRPSFLRTLLEEGSYEEFGNIAATLNELGARSLLGELVDRALAHPDPDVREVGTEYAPLVRPPNTA